mgnify:CR=1 FL=1
MRIAKLHIYGYGPWKEKVITLGSSFHVLYGENEAGKTALLSFVESMLFGFPKRQQNELRYAPKHGGIHGGKISIDLGEKKGQLIIERISGREPAEAVIVHNGQEIEESELQLLLHGMDRALFRQLYATRLEHLRTLENLSEDDLNRFLFSASISELTALAPIEAILERKRMELFKPLGKNPVINQALAELKTLSEQVEKSGRKKEQYEKKANEKKNMQARLDVISNEKKSLRRKERLYEKAQSIEPIYTELKRLESKYVTLADVDSFPTDGLLRLEKLQSPLLALKSEENVLKEKIKHAPQRKHKPPLLIAFAGGVTSAVFWMIDRSLVAVVFILFTAFVFFDFYRRQTQSNVQTKDEEHQLAIIQAKIREHEKAVAALFQEAGCDSEDAFRKKEKAWAERDSIVKRMEWLNQQLVGQLPDEPERQKVLRYLEEEGGTDTHFLEMAIMETQTEKRKLEREETVLHKRLAEVQVELNKMIEEGEYDTLYQRLEMKRIELVDLVKKWAVFTVALDVLKKTKARYRADRLPQVVSLATDYFSRLTNGNYVTIQVPVEGQRFIVQSRKGVRYLPIELSRGTQEQLYLALRLSLATVYPSRRFPLILDDILVHFDKTRRQAALTVLQEVANAHQVLIMTCHDHIVEECNERHVIHLGTTN